MNRLSRATTTGSSQQVVTMHALGVINIVADTSTHIEHHSGGWPRLGSIRALSNILAGHCGSCQAVQSAQTVQVARAVRVRRFRRFSGSLVQTIFFIFEHARTRAVEVRFTR